MNQSELSEEFGRNMETLTGTEFEIDSESDDFMDNLEGRIRTIKYNLWMDAQSNTLANYLKRKMSAHFEQLYEFSYSVSMYEEDYSIPRGTEALALMIIDEKEAYEKRIERLYRRYERFESITSILPPSSKSVVMGYFKHRKKIEYELLRTILIKHLNEIESVYKEDELQQEADADRLEDEYQAEQGRRRYLIERRYVYMTPDEYINHVENEKNERKRLYERLGLSMS